LAKLIIYEDEAGEEMIFEDFDLLTNRILIGSSPDNQLVLEAPDIDPAHASLELRYDHWILQDLGAPGGTAVNGLTIEGPYFLQHDDLIELGQIKLRFREMELPAEAEPEPVEEQLQPDVDPPVKGRIWFAKVASSTILVIIMILLLLITAHYFGLLNMADLLPPWLGYSG
jgi:pSer/pThr/pTyr-binding forkhead associated (FHA) protein